MKPSANIYFFSGTGNTAFLAEKTQIELAAKFNVKKMTLNKKSKISLKAKMNVILVPIACQSTYPFIWDLFETIPKGNNENVIIITTMAAASGAMQEEIRELLLEKNYNPIAYNEVIMPSNLKEMSTQKIFECLEKAETEIKLFWDHFHNNRLTWNKIEKDKTLFEQVRNRALWKKLINKINLKIDTETCTLCKKCILICPVQNIEIKKKTIILGEHCESCLKCISNCPENAITSTYSGYYEYHLENYLEYYKMKNEIERLYNKETPFSSEDFELFNEFKLALNSGEIRAAEYTNGEWKTNAWVKKGILLGFKMGEITEMANSNDFHFTDKHTYPTQSFTDKNQIRLVPGGSSVRDGAYIAKKVTMMPPMYVNTGAYIDEGTLIDSHALVGSCAQIGKHVHLSAGAMIGGVLEPINATPVIIEDNAFIGGNTGLYEGVIVKQRAIIAAGVVITSSTPLYDSVNNCWIKKEDNKPLIIPENAVVVSGSRALKSNQDIQIYCPVIIKYRDEKSDNSVQLENLLR